MSSHTAIASSTVSSLVVDSSASNVLISNTDIAGSGGTGIEVKGQLVTITQPDFIGDIATPILLAEGANANVKPPDISKVFRKMSGDGSLVNEVVGEVENAGSVELFLHEGDGQNKKMSYLKNCPVDKKENTKYPSSDVISDGAWVFICTDLSEPLNKQISFTITDSNGNTSKLSDYIKLADISEFPSTGAPPVTLPAPITPGVTGGGDDDDDSPPESRIAAGSDGMDVDSGGPPVGRGCMGSIAGAPASSPLAPLFIMIGSLSALIVRRFL